MFKFNCLAFNILLILNVFLCASDLGKSRILFDIKSEVPFKPAAPKLFKPAAPKLFEKNANDLRRFFDLYEKSIQEEKPKEDVQRYVTAIENTLKAIDDLIPEISRSRHDMLNLIKSSSRPYIYNIIRKNKKNLDILKYEVIAKIKNFADPDEENEFTKIAPLGTQQAQSAGSELEASARQFKDDIAFLKQIVGEAESHFQKNDNMLSSDYLDKRIEAIRLWTDKDAQIAALQLLGAYYHAYFKSGDKTRAERYFFKINNELRAIANKFSEQVQPLIVSEKRRRMSKATITQEPSFIADSSKSRTLFFNAEKKFDKYQAFPLVMKQQSQKAKESNSDMPYYRIHKIGLFSREKILTLGQESDILTQFCKQSRIPDLEQLKKEKNVGRLNRYRQTMKMCAFVQGKSEQEPDLLDTLNFETKGDIEKQADSTIIDEEPQEDLWTTRLIFSPTQEKPSTTPATTTATTTATVPVVPQGAVAPVPIATTVAPVQRPSSAPTTADITTASTGSVTASNAQNALTFITGNQEVTPPVIPVPTSDDTEKKRSVRRKKNRVKISQEEQEKREEEGYSAGSYFLQVRDADDEIDDDEKQKNLKKQLGLTDYTGGSFKRIDSDRKSVV